MTEEQLREGQSIRREIAQLQHQLKVKEGLNICRISFNGDFTQDAITVLIPLLPVNMEYLVNAYFDNVALRISQLEKQFEAL